MHVIFPSDDNEQSDQIELDEMRYNKYIVIPTAHATAQGHRQTLQHGGHEKETRHEVVKTRFADVAEDQLVVLSV